MSLISKSFSLAHKTALINRTLIRSLSSCMNKTQYLIKQEEKILNKTINKPILNQILKLNLTNQPNDIQKQIAQMIKSKPVVVFMKGTKSQPMCGFSKAVVDILRIHGVDFDTYNVLADESLRSGIKEFSNWPTIPQVFFNGEFVGGCDILLDMHRSGDLVDELKKIGIESKADDEDHDQKK